MKAPKHSSDQHCERLSRPGYEKMVAGVTLAGDEVTTGPELTKPLDYETFRFPDPQPLPTFYRPDREMQLAATATGANAAAPQRAGTGRTFAPPRRSIWRRPPAAARPRWR